MCIFKATAITMLLLSQHHTGGDYNERHHGIGVEHPVSCSVAAVGGTYVNSYERRSYYAGVQWEHETTKYLRLGAVGLVGTGYPTPVGGALTARAGPVRLLHVPANVTALQLRMEF